MQSPENRNIYILLNSSTSCEIMATNMNIFYKTKNSQQTAYLEEKMKLFLENYTINGDGHLIISGEEWRVNIEPNAQGLIDLVKREKNNPEGKLLDWNKSGLTLSIDKFMYSISFNPKES